jgi:methyltransferase (TIGR00027 family)
MARIENVSGTAFVVAEFRAEENDQPEPLYQDWVVGLFLSEDSKRAAARVAARFPPVRDLVRIRTKYLDDMLDDQLQSDFQQVVILGAGLDTRAVRKHAAGVSYFEIDDGATLRAKQACYEEQGFNVNVTFIHGDYVTDGLIPLLRQHGFSCDLPTYFIWEGNTMYLPIECTKRIINEIRNSVGRFRLSFDYMAESVIANTTGDAGIASLVDSFASMGAPWQSGIGDIHALAREHDVHLIENVSTSALYRSYWRGRPMTSPIFDLYSVCTLGRS